MDADKLVGLVEHAIGQAVARLDARLIVVEGRTTALDTRVGAVEVARALPGPTGPPGPAGIDGKDGKDGINGKDGSSVRYCGVYSPDATYNAGDLVTYNGSMWHANDASGTQRPGDGPAWTLAVKNGKGG